MRKPNYNEILAIVAKRERADTRSSWELADGLIQVLGPPPKAGGNDGSAAKLADLSEFLEEHGYEYEASTLRMFRITAAAYPASRRLNGVSYSAHQVAADPDTLDAIVEAAPRNQPVTMTYVKAVMRGLALERQHELDAEAERRRKAHDAATREKEEAEAAQKRATTAAERREAGERAAAAGRKQAKNKTPPKRREVPKRKPKAEDVPILLARVAFERDLSQARKTVEQLRETYAAFIPVLDQDELSSAVEDLVAIAETARSFADQLRQRLAGKPGHLQVVGE